MGELTFKDIQAALEQTKGNKQAAAQLVGLTESSFRRRLRKFNLEAVNGDEQRRLQKELNFYRNRCTKLEADNILLQNIRSHILSLSEREPKQPKWMLSTTKQDKEVPVLFTSDFQWGEVVSKNETNGINEYNLEIAKRRYRELISATINICFNYQTHHNYPGIVYLRGGDSISGSIHAELKETNEVPSMNQVYDLMCEEIEGLNKLADAFGKVAVFSVPGNHGRTSEKPQAKLYAQTNFDYLLSLLLEMHFKKDSRFTFVSPLSGDYLFRVYATRFLLTHGDRIGSRGGQGFIGPAATIMRGVKKVKDMYARLSQPIDWVLVGHFHSAMVLPGAVANGTLVGYSEYALSFRAEPELPSQTLFFVNPKWGLNQYRKLVLEDPEHGAMQWLNGN